MQAKLLIVGGTSGVGLALAKAHENWEIHIVGSSVEKMARLRHDYPHWHIWACDVCDENQRNDLFEKLSKFTPFQRVIYAAGWYLNERRFELNATDSTQMLAVNFQAFAHTFAWAAQHVQAACTHRATLVCLSSVAGLVNYPYTSLYAQCKRAMWHTAVAYRTALLPHNIHVLCVASGYVDTETLRHINGGSAAHKPFIISEQRAVQEILGALAKGETTAVFPKRMKYLVKFLNVLPKPMVARLMRQKLDKPI